MLQINMLSSADKVKGQGVGSAYLELIQLLKKYHAQDIDLTINKLKSSDITHYHTIDVPFYLSTFFTKRVGRKVGYVHFLPSTLKGSIRLPNWMESILYKYVVSFYKRMDHLVVVNPIFIEELMKFGIEREKITYIPNFVSKADFFPYEPNEKRGVRVEKGIDSDRFIVFGAGQVQERKGIRDFVELAKEMPEVQFMWAGGFSFGKITDGYEEYKQMMDNPPENLQFTGIIDRNKMRDYYNIADLFLLPSHDELFPMCILESFACHTPVALRDLPLYKPVLEGYYNPCSNKEEMKKCITHLKDNPLRYEDAKQKAIAGNEDYSEERLAGIWLDFYKEQEAKE